MIVAIDALDARHPALAKQPDDGERDRYGHFKGCFAYSCAATQCRDLADYSPVVAVYSKKLWYWAVRE